MSNLKDKFLQSKEFEKIKALQDLDFTSSYELLDCININCDKNLDEKIKELVLDLKPWRKGPFKINELFIDAEWQSFVKFNLLKPFMHEIKDKIVADVGCNNGYYMFKMLEFSPAKLVGFDPCLRPFLQFHLLNTLIKSKIEFEALGVEDLPLYKLKFDVIFCLGVLYHRSDPIKMLKNLKMSLNKGGIVFLDTMYIEDEREIALIPRKTYSKISNIFFIPSILGLRNWCERAGFKEFEILALKQTDSFEQRKTAFSEGFSLEDFLDTKDKNFTCEGYEAPKRIYVKLKA
ncbi:tRNA 5-methoxyuridine(34)/uridine 5-oxyacetic acid(34) synthase CmoB [Campylobacter sp. MIT 99-7217]|uniref:tRNA 5-methoxyuridine(34)/uridine 5-oxyacetic acid(34) synthase CmoB n=1 Tax=Campylobacter sp. MIT 99-7217 TaxID=535091 RepID=UPI0011586A1B|nr:tRNA 5-methoxyuridine(34)/uridine 5-oxyacetic acid(34) synthase CmoB [Campylobacter sp. MIT 99-7217]